MGAKDRIFNRMGVNMNLGEVKLLPTIPVGIRRYLPKSKIVTWSHHYPWEYIDLEPRVHNLQIFLAGTCCEPVDHLHS